jgi:hypothetical protein
LFLGAFLGLFILATGGALTPRAAWAAETAPTAKRAVKPARGPAQKAGAKPRRTRSGAAAQPVDPAAGPAPPITEPEQPAAAAQPAAASERSDAAAAPDQSGPPAPAADQAAAAAGSGKTAPSGSGKAALSGSDKAAPSGSDTAAPAAGEKAAASKTVDQAAAAGEKPRTAPAGESAPAPPGSAAASEKAAAGDAAASSAESKQAAVPPPAGAARPVVPFDGVVLEKGNRDPLAGIRVTVTPWRVLPPPADKNSKVRGPTGEPTGEPIEQTTDPQGRFHYDELPPGTYQVILRGPLIQKTQSVETLTAGKRTSITYFAPKRGNPFEVVVRAEAVRKEITETVLSVNELKRIPGTNNDAIKAVQNLPGVARAPFISGLLVVWGSAPNDTRVYADGVLIPVLYHFGGLRATINSEFVSQITFKPGAYSADFGRGLGGIVDVATRSPKDDRVHGSLTLDLIDGSLTLEGPITKKLHFAVGARLSWISAFLPLFNRSNIQVSPFYWDYQVALRYRPTKSDDLDLFIFGSSDSLEARVENPDPATNVDLNTKNYFSRARLRWTHRFSTDTVLTVMPSVGTDTVRLGSGDAAVGIGGVSLSLNILSLVYNLRSELRHRFTSWFNVAGGVDFEGSHTSFDVLAPQLGGNGSGGGGGGGGGGAPLSVLSSVRDQSALDILRTAPYVIARFEFFDKRLAVSPQFRFDASYIRSYQGTYERTLLSPEPRLLVFGQVVPKYLLLKFGIGLFSQLPQPQELAQSFGNPLLLAERGTTYVAGVESDITATLNVQGQFFYKDLRSLVVSDPTTRFNNGGLGRVVGGDFLIRQKLWRGLFGWIAYTVSKSERKDSPEDPWRLFRFDQTHILTIIASYKLPWWNLEVGVRFRYVTGNPATPVVGGLRDTTSQDWLQINGGIYSTRLPAFQQLDLRIDKTWVFNRWKLGLYLDIQNLYNYSNSEATVYGGRQLYQSAGITGIPFFPNIGLRADF